MQLREFDDVDAIRSAIFNRVMGAVQKKYPVENDRYRLEIDKLRWNSDKPISISEQKKALLSRQSLSRKLMGTWQLVDKATGVVVDKRPGVIAHVPYLTQRGTFIHKGTEYTISNQMRLRPAVYTRRKENKELEAHFNALPGTGRAFRVFMQPETGVFKMRIGQANIPMYPVMRTLGIADKDLEQWWGKDLLNVNRGDKQDPQAISKIYKRLIGKDAPADEQAAAIGAEFSRMEMDPDVMQRNLGPWMTPPGTKQAGPPVVPTNITPNVMLATTRKLMDIREGKADPDDRDSLANQIFMGPEDFFAERIIKDAGGIARKILWNSTNKSRLAGVYSGALTPQMQGVLLNSGMGSPLEEINPIEALDQMFRVSRLGEGGIPSTSAIPSEARAVQPSQFGFIDPWRGPECYDDQTEVFTYAGWKKWSEVEDAAEFAVLINGRLDFFPADRIVREQYCGKMYGFKTKYMDYLVTPGHRIWCAYQHDGTPKFRMDTAENVHRKLRWFKCGGHDEFIGRYEGSTFRLPTVPEGSNAYREAPPIGLEDWAEFLGWYLSEGSCCYVEGKLGQSSNYGVSISQTKEEGLRKLDKLIKRIPFKWTYSDRAWRTGRKQLASYLKQFGRSEDKFIPEEFFHYQPAVRRRLMEGLLAGDGRIGRNGRKISYCSASKKLADGFQRLAISLGYSTSFGFEPDYREERYFGRHRVSLHLRNARVSGLTKTSRARQFYISDYDGMVYCAAVPGGLLYVRRGKGIAHWSGNSEKLGVDTRLAFDTYKGDDGHLYSNFRDIRTGKIVPVSARDAANKVLAFPGEMAKKERKVRAMVRGRLSFVDRKEVDYELPHVSGMMNAGVNLVPMSSATQGNRLLMAGKAINQALALRHPEAPLVQSATPQAGISFEQLLGRKVGAVFSKSPGIVRQVRKDKIVVDHDDGTKESYELYNNFPLNRKSYLHNTPAVKAGDRVRPDQLLARSNFTNEKGDLAIGTNLRVAFTPYKGLSVSGSTRIFWVDDLGYGHFTPIKDILLTGKVKANALIAGDWEVVTQDVQSYIAHRAAGDMCSIGTLDGDTIKTTASHSFVTLSDNGELVPIYPEDMVPGRTVVPITPLRGVFSNKYKSVCERGQRGRPDVNLPLDRDIGFLFGLYIAEGWTGKPSKKGRHKNVGLAIVEPELLDRISAICDKFGLTYTYKLHKVKTKAGRNARSGVFTIYCAALARLLAARCGSGCTRKCLPEEVWASNEEFAAGLISGYWSGDGTATDRQVSASTTSKVLAEELCALLSALGVRATFRSYFPKVGREIYFVKIFKHSLKAFPKLDVLRKQERIDSLRADEDKFSRDRIPIPKRFRAATVKAIGYNIPRSGYISRGKLLRVRDDLPKEVQALVDSDVWWDVVQSVEAAEPEDVVFDLDMSPVGNFVVGSGLVVHNTYEDAYVMSESAARKMSSEQMYTPELELERGTEAGYNRFISQFPTKYNKAQLKAIGEDGVAKPGTVVKKGDPLILAIGKIPRKAAGQWSQIARRTQKMLRDSSVEWEHDFEGVVTDAVPSKEGIQVAVRAYVPLKDGDKITGRMGDKGVIAKVVPDDQMPTNAQGLPFEVMQNPATLPSRLNPAQVFEMQLAKIARKTGKPIQMPAVMDESIVEYVKKQLKLHNLKDTEDLSDPELGKKIKDVLTGEKFFMKLHHTSESKWGARETGGYTCFDEETEVLTWEGWRLWSDVTEATVFATEVEGILCYEKSSKLAAEWYDGELLGFSGRYVDYCVTPNHRMYVSSDKKKKKEQMAFRRADDIHGKRFNVVQGGFKLPTVATKKIKIPERSKRSRKLSFSEKDYASFVGWWVTEGSVYINEKTAEYSVIISQSILANPEKFAEIEALCHRMGMVPSRQRSGKPYAKGIRVRYKSLAYHMKELGRYSREKHLPRSIFRFSKAARLACLTSMMAGDGSTGVDRFGYVVEKFESTSKQLVDDLQELALTLGYTGVVREHNRPIIGRTWTIGLSRKRVRATVRQYKDVAVFYRKYYRGMVYCATVPTGKLIVRRNGKVMISGNSEGLPSSGGKEGSKTIANLGINALLSHGACFLGATNVMTERGWLEISKIVKKRLDIKVASVNSRTGDIEYKRVIDWFCRSVSESELMVIKTFARTGKAGKGIRGSHRAIRCTRGHEFLVPEGTTQAAHLKAGDALLTIGTYAEPWQYQMMLGMLLGDGYISGRGKRAGGLAVCHGHKQVWYLNWKYKLLRNFGVSKPKLQKLSKGGFTKKPTSRFTLRSHPVLDRLRELFYPEGKKVVPKGVVEMMGLRGIALWFGDDGGCVRPRNKKATSFRLHTNAFSVVEVERLAEELKEYTGLGWRCYLQNGKYPILTLPKRGNCGNQLEAWAKLLAPYLPKKFNYKLGGWATATGSAWDGMCAPVGEFAEPCYVKSVGPYKLASYESSLVYNITVEDNHSYIVHGVAVGNTEVLRDTKLIRGQKNDDFWRSFRLGYPPPTPDIPMVYKKFISHLRGAGINVRKDGDRLNILAMTDKDVEAISKGRITSADTVNAKDLQPIAGGLFDRGITGAHGGAGWGHIELPEPLPNPVMEEPIRRLLGLTQKDYESVIRGTKELNGRTGGVAIQESLSRINIDQEIDESEAQIKGRSGAARDNAIKKLRYLKMAKKNNIHPKDFVISKVPVLPPNFRPISQLNDKMQVSSDANYLYQDLLFNSEAYSEMKKELGRESAGTERLNTYRALKAVVGLGDPVHPKLQEKNVGGLLKHVFGKGSPKWGLYQRRVIGSKTDMAGRAVITPNPSLDMDQVGLPEDQAWKSYKPFVVRRLVQKGMNATQAAKYVEDRDPRARDELIEEMERRPIIISRAPTLHKYGMMAAFPQLVKGHTLQVSPVVTPGFGADFDGDQQIDHVYILLTKELTDAGREAILQICPELKENDMSARFREVLPVSVGESVHMIHLSAFPHEDKVKTTKGRHGPIDWYTVPDGVKVISYNEHSGKLESREVKYWTVHQGCAVEIVRLKSGREIFTDNDPRAVYGAPAGSIVCDRFTPVEAVKRRVLVPRMRKLSVSEATVEQVSTPQFTETSRRAELQSRVTLTSDVGYLLGVLVGDGWVSGPKGQDKDVCIAGITSEIVDKIDDIIPTLFKGKSPTRCTVVSTESYGESRRHTYTSVALAVWVKPLIGHRARGKHLPAFWMSASKEFRLGLFAGLMDTDGSISISKGKKKPQLMSNYFSTSLKLIQEVQLLAASLDIVGRTTPTKTPAGLPAWVISWSSIDVKRWGGLYMLHPEKLEKLGRVEVLESPSYVRHDVIPMDRELAGAAAKAISTPKDHSKWADGLPSVYAAISKAKSLGYITRATAKRIEQYLSVDSCQLPGWSEWQQIIDAEGVTWDMVVETEATGRVEPGYDLTVPGTETFMNVGGVILSNTMSYHVPVSEKAVEEATSKMLPSNNLRSASEFDIHYVPRHEYQLGLYQASTKRTEEPAKRFLTTKAAVAAYKRGEIDLGDEVIIQGGPK